MWDKQRLEILYDAISYRRSVRKYSAEPIEERALNGIRERWEDLMELIPREPVAFRILEPGQLRGIVSARAPHFLAVYSGPDKDARTHAAFMLQQMDLWLSAEGYGTCWLGMPKPAEGLEQADGLDYVILLAFGAPAEPQRRKDTAEFKRKALPEITNIAGQESLLEAVRLAPSGTNRQPWYFTGDGKAIHLHGKKNGFFASKVYGGLPDTEMGIALCHLWLSALHHDSFSGFSRNENPEWVQGYEYVWSVLL